MPNVRIRDLRSDIKTLDDARACFDDLAMNILKLAAVDAAFERRIGKLKTAHAEAIAPEAEQIKEKEARLARFIEQNKALFQDPRKAQTSFGSFGLQALSEVVIARPEILEKYLREKGLKDCFKDVFTPVKTAIKKRLAKKEKIPGVFLKEGDAAVMQVSKAMLESAKTGTPLALAAANI